MTVTSTARMSQEGLRITGMPNTRPRRSPRVRPRGPLLGALSSITTMLRGVGALGEGCGCLSVGKPTMAGMPSPLPLLPMSLSPSRAMDFKSCPLLYRFRSVDRLPEDPTPEMARGTLVHAVLERLYDVSAVNRTPAAAVSMVAPEWERLRGEDERLAGIFAEGDPAVDGWL